MAPTPIKFPDDSGGAHQIDFLSDLDCLAGKSTCRSSYSTVSAAPEHIRLRFVADRTPRYHCYGGSR